MVFISHFSINSVSDVSSKIPYIFERKETKMRMGCEKHGTSLYCLAVMSCKTL